jgi:hypothetical protein
MGPSLTSDCTAQCIDFLPTTTEANYETFGAYQGNDDGKGEKKMRQSEKVEIAISRLNVHNV